MSDRFHVWRENEGVYVNLTSVRCIVSEKHIAWWKKRNGVVDMGHTAISQAVNAMATRVGRNSCSILVLVSQTKPFIEEPI
jgi:hypothetical protein